MREKLDSMEKLPYNQVAKEIGSALSQSPDIYNLTQLKQPFPMIRIGQTPFKPNIPLRYQSKRHLFEGKVGDEEVIIEHYSDVYYCQDPDYFKRMYQDARDFFGGQSTVFTDKKIGPILLGRDDETMTLIIEKARRDLSAYYRSADENEIRQLIGNFVDLVSTVWKCSKRKNNQHPRYVRTFLAPEYFFLEDKKIEDYLKDKALIAFYKQTQTVLKEYLKQTDQFSFSRGFGLPDVKPSNLVEDEEGNILFIDISKPEFAYHWLTQLGQFLQGATKEAPNSLFTQILKRQAIQIIEPASQSELAVRLFVLGRMNRLFILCTLRNIVYNTEIGQSVDEKMIRKNLTKIRNLMKTTSTEEMVK